MGDWEDDDWEASADTFKPVAVAASKPTAAGEEQTKGQSVLAKATEPDMSKFADEDQGEPEPVAKLESSVKTQPKKKEEKKWLKGDAVDDTQLDDPVEEKLRRQRLVEQADYAAAKDLFGDAGGVNLDLFLPKSAKDFEDFASTIAAKFILPHKDSKNYKVLVKALAKKACEPLNANDSKEVEACVGVVRVEKTKAEQAAKAATKSAPKKSLNHGGKGGISAGLDDYVYDDAGDADDDFM